MLHQLRCLEYTTGQGPAGPVIQQLVLGQCQTSNKVEKLSHSTLLCDKVERQSCSTLLRVWHWP